MVHIALLGYGVVGSGIVQVLAQNRAHIEKKAGQVLAVKRVLDIRSFPGDPVSPILTHDYEDILNDDEIKIVAEAMGGLEPAFTYVKQALLKGKHVCTSNKELVAVHGAELLAIARERELNFLFEASVGGGIPIIRPMNLALTTDEIVGVAGILNGTTNYILTHMSDEDKGFNETLSEAQSLGYAEKDPSADIGGYDTCRKLAILMSLATGRQVNYQEIYTEGVTNLSQADFAFARAFGYTIKLLADGRVAADGSLEAMAAPMLVPAKHLLSAVTDVFNGVLVQARMTDSLMFMGRGAGKLPTACAVVSDMVDISKHLHRHILHEWSPENMPVSDVDAYIKGKMLRVSYTNEIKALEAIQHISGDADIKKLPGYPGQLAWVVSPETERETAARLKMLAHLPFINGGAHALRIYEPIALTI